VIDITDHLAIIERRVASALAEAGRPADDHLLLAVSKGQPTEAIEAALAAGIVNFGENYVDEAIQKIEQLRGLDIRWHFIGRIQGNKTRAIAENFDWVHTLDRSRVAVRLNAQRPPHIPPMNALIQVNLAGDAQKGGVDAATARSLALEISRLPRLRLRGLMTIPPASLAPPELRAHFQEVAALITRLSSEFPDMTTVSMGMSGDFEAAIACGSNCVRIGTAIFGKRNAPAP
jgi:hypothetical protein